MALGKRKRCEDMSPVPCNKRRKAAGFNNAYTTVVQGYNPFFQLATSIAAQHIGLSPLLRLPTELRDRIWNYAYGNLRVHVSIKSLNKRAEDSHRDLEYTYCESHPETIQSARHSLKLPPTACKRFYSEAIAAFYASATFEFTEVHTFRAFALSQHSCVTQLRHLSIPQLSSKWGEALTSSLVGRLTGLRGVNFSKTFYRYTEDGVLPHATHSYWKDRRVWHIIRSFQQHKLYAHLTNFNIIVTNVYHVGNFQYKASKVRLLPTDPQYNNLQELQRDFRIALVQHNPRRLSRRGARKGNDT